MEENKVFNRYNEIKNTAHVKYINKLIHEYNDIKYVITEKIHGSNLGFGINLENKNIYYISRNNIVNENFMKGSVGRVFERINPNIDNIINVTIEKLKLRNEDIKNYKYIIIYGELFGGLYNHPDIPKDPNGVRIQKGISYCPFNDWLAFDIVLLKERTPEELETINLKIKEYEEELKNYKDNNDPNIRTLKNNIDMFNKMCTTLKAIYLDFDDFIDILSNSNIKTVPILKITDSLDEAIAFGNIFESEVYKLYNLPKIENNYAEGTVIKPLKTEYMNNGRIIIKNKNPEFQEILHYDNNDNKKEYRCNDVTYDLIDKIHDYINESRLESIISKLPRPITKKNFGAVIKEMNKDIINDIEIDWKELIDEVIRVDEYRIFTKVTNKKVVDFLKSKINDIIDDAL